jgi:REP element-mobilizing transposase RayT
MPHVDIGEFVVMPNHVHGIVVIRERLVGPVRADHDRPETIPDHDTMQTPVTMSDHGIMMGSDATPTFAKPDATNDGPDDHTANAPTAQRRADHGRPLRTHTPRTMPIVPVGSLGRIVRAYKSAVTRLAYRDGLLPHGTPVWQRNYWDRVIRDDGEYARIAQYIRDNPQNWKGDRFNKR